MPAVYFYNIFAIIIYLLFDTTPLTHHTSKKQGAETLHFCPHSIREIRVTQTMHTHVAYAARHKLIAD